MWDKKIGVSENDSMILYIILLVDLCWLVEILRDLLNFIYFS